MENTQQTAVSKDVITMAQERMLTMQKNLSKARASFDRIGTIINDQLARINEQFPKLALSVEASQPQPLSPGKSSTPGSTFIQDFVVKSNGTPVMDFEFTFDTSDSREISAMVETLENNIQQQAGIQKSANEHNPGDTTGKAPTAEIRQMQQKVDELRQMKAPFVKMNVYDLKAQAQVVAAGGLPQPYKTMIMDNGGKKDDIAAQIRSPLADIAAYLNQQAKLLQESPAGPYQRSEIGFHAQLKPRKKSAKPATTQKRRIGFVP